MNDSSSSATLDLSTLRIGGAQLGVTRDSLDSMVGVRWNHGLRRNLSVELAESQMETPYGNDYPP